MTWPGQEHESARQKSKRFRVLTACLPSNRKRALRDIVTQSGLPSAAQPTNMAIRGEANVLNPTHAPAVHSEEGVSWNTSTLSLFSNTIRVPMSRLKEIRQDNMNNERIQTGPKG